MKKSKNIIIFVVCFMFNQALAGQDSGDVFEQINNSFAIGLAGLNVNYKEILTLPAKSTEAGTVFGLTIDWKHTFSEKIYTDFYLDLYLGRLEYDGAAFIDLDINEVGKLSCNIIPYKDDRFYHIFSNVDVKLGYILTFDDNSSFQIIPYIGTGARYWGRQINVKDAIGRDAFEEYVHFKYIVGVKFDYLLSDNFVLSPYIDGGKTFCAYMNTKDAVFKLGSKPIYSAGLEWNYKMSHKFFLTGFVNYTHFEYGKSEPHDQSIYIVTKNVLVTYPFYEPSSKTNEVKVGLGVRFG